MTIARFDSSVAWAALSPEQQKIIGALAIDLIVAWDTNQRAESKILKRAASEVGRKSAEELAANVKMMFRRDLNVFDLQIPVSLGPVCELCGCSQDDGCDDGCAWANDDKTICTECVGKVTARAS